MYVVVLAWVAVSFAGSMYIVHVQSNLFETETETETEYRYSTYRGTHHPYLHSLLLVWIPNYSPAE